MIRGLALWIAGLLALTACSRDPDPPQPPAGAPALWQIEDAKGAVEGWLFGTIHALPKGTRWQTPALEGALGKARILVVEVRDLDPAVIAPVFARLAQDCPCPPLAERLPPAERPALALALDDMAASPQQYDRTETWAAALAIAAADANAADFGAGADQALLARFRHKSIRELEGAERQLAIFDRLPEPAQRAMLAEVATAHKDAGDEIARLARAWLAGDMDAIARETRRGLLAEPALYDALLKNRNRAWLDRLGPLLDRSDPAFIAVGAAHLPGPDGLIAGLVARGHVLRRLH